MPNLTRRSLAAGALAAPWIARAEGAPITVGALLSLTGPGASLGVPERNTLEIVPRTVGGRPVRVVVLDDLSDPTAAVRAARKLVEEEHVDIILGPTVTPTSLAALDVAGQSGTPMMSLAGSSSIVEPPEGNRRWAFKPAPADALMVGPITAHMAAQGIHDFASIGFSTAFGDGQLNAMDAAAQKQGLTSAPAVRYNPTDTSVTPQVLRLMGGKPSAVFVAASGTPGALPMIELRQRGYTGPIYSTQGIANADFLRVGGRSLEGLVFTVSPALVAEQLPDGNPVKPVALAYVKAYEDKFGPGTRSLFGATMWDAFLMLEAAAPAALAAAQPGTAPFRTALRDGLERIHGMVGAQGLFNLSPTDHSGSGPSAQVLVTVKDGGWLYVSG